ncbi:MAG TPA: Hsp20/alpha crystallin family protein [Planctomycetaceae bacterium]
MAENTTLMTRENGAAAATQDRPTYRPQVDVYETEDRYFLIADVPGSSEEDIDLTLEKDVLTLHARVAEPQFEGFEPRWRGYGVGDWRRSFRLGEAVDREGIDAAVKDGVLRVSLPKAKESLRKSIQVKRLD